MYMYLPLGYRDLNGASFPPGVYTRNVIGSYWQTILNSQRGYLINEAGATLEDEKPRVTPMVEMYSVLRAQYERLMGVRIKTRLTSEALIDAIVTQQASSQPQVDTLDDLRARYLHLSGKQRVYYKWDNVETLRLKIAELEGTHNG